MSIFKSDFQSVLRTLGILMLLSLSRWNASPCYTFLLGHFKLYFFTKDSLVLTAIKMINSLMSKLTKHKLRIHDGGCNESLNLLHVSI